MNRSIEFDNNGKVSVVGEYTEDCIISIRDNVDYLVHIHGTSQDQDAPTFLKLLGQVRLVLDIFDTERSKESYDNLLSIFTEIKKDKFVSKYINLDGF